MGMKIIYGLHAKGNSTCDWKFTMFCKQLFLTKDEAEKHKPIFKEKCCDTKQLNCAEPDTLQITIVEYELNE